jgi:hypothetical protein
VCAVRVPRGSEYWAAGSLHEDGVVKASITVEEVRFVVVYPESLGGGSSS